MFAKWKAKFAAKKASAHAVDESRKWKKNPLFQDCLHAMRGSCTVAPADLHEAVITAVNIAIREDTWAELSAASEDLFGGMVYLVWGEATFPVLWAPWAVAVENLKWIRIVDPDAFIVSETMDKILWFSAQDRISFYNIT
ncbi:MAG: hypothetical protein IKD27_03850 [Oscillospiraceae bacterium]|nr:hypothetical protein [Oscillospiraceae bacterium]